MKTKGKADGVDGVGLEVGAEVKRLEEIEARAGAATSGPWSNAHWYARAGIGGGILKLDGDRCAFCHHGPPVGRAGGDHVHCFPNDGDNEHGWRKIVSDATRNEVCGNYEYEDGGVSGTPEDARFIAAARADVPWLCTQLRAAVALLDEARTLTDEEWTRRRRALLAALDEVTR